MEVSEWRRVNLLINEIFYDVIWGFFAMGQLVIIVMRAQNDANEIAEM